MNMKRLKEKIITDNDVYFLAVVRDKIILNSNYDGIVILDSHFNFIKGIPILHGLMIHDSFVNHEKNQIVLSCPDNNCFVCINLEDFSHKVVNFNFKIDDHLVLFSRAFWCKQGTIIMFSPFSEKYGKISSGEHFVKIIDKCALKEECCLIYDSIVKMQNLGTKHLIHDNGYAIDGKTGLMLFDLEGNLINTIEGAEYGSFTNILLKNTYIVLLSEYMLRVLNNTIDDSIRLFSHEALAFSKVNLLENSSMILIVLMSDKRDCKKNKLLALKVS